MKKIIVFLMLLVPACLYADMTCTATIDQNNAWSSGAGSTYQAAKRLKIMCEMAADSDPAEVVVSDVAGESVLNQVKGGIFRQVTTQPGVNAPAAVITVEFDNQLGAGWFSITTTSTSLAEEWDVSSLVGYYPVFWDCQIDFPDIGDTGDNYVLYFDIIK